MRTRFLLDVQAGKREDDSNVYVRELVDALIRIRSLSSHANAERAIERAHMIADEVLGSVENPPK